MRVLVCGDRNWTDYRMVAAALEAHHRTVAPGEPFVVIEGGARGADALAARWAFHRSGVDHERYPADWDRYGKRAGPIRNQRMLTEGEPDVVLAFHDDLEASKGTAHMVRIARAAGVPVVVLRHEPCPAP
ncbi:MAG TPA: DUF2493 domain-containing protein [Acidimicrobiales bacterium]